jgi:recombination protein RecA
MAKSSSRSAAQSAKAALAETTSKTKALELALSQIRKSHGEGVTMKFSDHAVSRHMDVISTGAISLDRALGVWGVPRGRVVEIYGPEASGKTTLALHVVANAQKGGGIAAYVDAEHAMDPTYSQAIGVNVDELLISQPDSGEQALDIVETLVRSNAVDVVVIDSVAALVPRAELEGEMGDAFVGQQARLMSQALRKLTSAISRSRTCVVFINQVREKIGVIYGNPEVTPGGRALKFYSSVRIEVRRIQSIKEGGENIGNRVRARVVKNKVAPPFRETEIEILFGKGISREGDLIDMGVALKIIDRSGPWLSYKNQRLGQGRENARQLLCDNPDLLQQIEAEIREQTGLAAAGAAGDSDTSSAKADE